MDDVTRCAVPCEARRDTCERANRSLTATAVVMDHYPGGSKCRGFMPVRACRTCVSWRRDMTPPGRMPGVSEDSRPCGRPRMEKDRIEWRAPTDLCDQWMEDMA